MNGVARKLKRVHENMERAGIPHAFGGAIALAFCVQDPRATVDLDVNVFVGIDQAKKVFSTLPRGVETSPERLDLVVRDGQVRLRWGETPIDLFFSYHPFHDHAESRTRIVPFDGVRIRVLDCTDLVVFKALFGRGKDWVDIETAAASGSVDRAEAARWISELMGADSDRPRRLAQAFAEADRLTTETPMPFGRPTQAGTTCGKWMPNAARACSRPRGHRGACR